MKHSGLVLYLIFNPHAVEMLSGAEAKALELCLPPSNWAPIILPGRRGFRTLDLVFEKKVQNHKNYYLVDVKSAKPYRGDFDKMREYVDDFKGCLGSPQWLKPIEIFSIIVYPARVDKNKVK